MVVVAIFVSLSKQPWRNLCKFVETIMADLPEVPWPVSKAKDLLEKDIRDGVIGCIEQGMPPAQVYLMREEYTAYEYTQFCSYLYNARLKWQEPLRIAGLDAVALAHDRGLGLSKNSKSYPKWGGSEAERCLKEDMDQGLHHIMSAADLVQSRPEYAPFVDHPKVFRDHIEQERRARRERPYWLYVRQQKEEKKRQKAIDKQKKKIAKQRQNEEDDIEGEDIEGEEDDIGNEDDEI